MATVEPRVISDDGDAGGAPRSPVQDITFPAAVRAVLQPLASLKLTVALFFLAIVIVAAGTMAQVDHDIWKVIHDYFRIDFSKVTRAGFPWIDLSQFFVWIDFQIFVPPAFFAGAPPDLPHWMGVWFPKGWTIGALMMINLFAAHALRFKVQAVGPRLVLGWLTIAFGCLVTALVVTSGSDADGVQHTSWLSYNLLWWVMQLSLRALTALSAVYAFNTAEQQRNVRWLLGGTAVLLAATGAGTFLVGPFDDSAMRIMYQLVKATLAGVVLLVGCILVFRKRAGIVLLHGGIGLMMVFDVLVGTAHVESRMMIEEGQTVRYSEDIRTVELAIVDKSDPDQDWHTVIPFGLLKQDAVIHNESLPFDVRVLEFFPNSDLQSLAKVQEADPSFQNPATAGVGQRFAAVNRRPTAGTDSESTVDHPSAYVEILEKETGKSLGTYVVSVFMQPPYFFGAGQSVTVGDHAYELALRFKRLYKPYEVTLVDVQKNDYKGTSNPRDYRSILKIQGDGGAAFEYPVWMNNPLRYAGETFYQSSYHPPGSLSRSETKEATTLQVVSNTGWMIPYVSCMIVAVGMLAQFALTLLRFLQRRLTAFDALRAVESPDGAPVRGPSPKSGRKSGGTEPIALASHRRDWIVPLTAALLTVVFIAMLAKPRSTPADAMNVRSFGELPVIYQGRTQPFDSLARNALVAISDKQTFKQNDGDRKERSRSAVEWLLQLIAKPEEAAQAQVFRIESVELVDLLGLERRPGSWRYGLDEFQKKWAELRPQVQEAIEAQSAKKPLSLIQRKQLELQRQVSLYDKLQTGFRDLSEMMPRLPSSDEITGNRNEAAQKLLELRSFLTLAREQIPGFGFPLSVPMHIGRNEQSFSAMEEADWVSYPLASIYASMDEQTQRPAPPGFVHLRSLFKAYGDGDAGAFNASLAEYRRILETANAKELAPVDSANVVSLAKSDFEAYFNGAAPFHWASWIYVAAFVLVACSWLGWTRPLNRAAFCVIAVTFVLHTLALMGRIYISGRPPVTNLYSSAVFIGWAGVLFGLALEMVYRLGVGNVIAAASGFLTLRIAHGLAMDGDTFHVLEAVLDTQFWLATHVVCVTLGYAATYVSALLGLVTIVRGVFTRSLSAEEERTLTRMNYGVLCFAIFFSFIGTVLGGLWADDSWGRFWGWDPKENGALIIVLWNALVLHARWDGMIKSRGLAVLTLLGGIVVSWSWFGVNELGVGLHSYGFTEGRLAWLGASCVTMLVLAGVGCLPRGLWRSHQVGKADLAA
ncbi:MAG: cytochrome c biogenesis protein CcsA [Planctomycetaceae bacterium]|nr:cytochrome c biogenesis protein CcsA [Planctomycetaceae bacterium]